jgi:ABC-type multidrug transport system fused ATPase/permease subunit
MLILSYADYKTDAIIQTSLRESTYMKDVTVITIAHRLQTIMDADKIVCLNLARKVIFVLTLN